MTPARALRVLLLANDGMSAGHVARAIAIARALKRRATERGAAVQLVLATTSVADSLLADEPFVLVRLPPPAVARRAGFSDVERRRIVRGVLEGLVESFAPDLVTVDTFPSGPHGELEGLDLGHAMRVLVRRAVPAERSSMHLAHAALTNGLERTQLAIVADDPFPLETSLPVETVRVPPITIAEPNEALPRAVARERLGLEQGGRVLLVTSGGGGDPDAVRSSRELALGLARLAPDATIVRAAGPLERSPSDDRVRTIHVAPLQPLLAAFDGAFAAAGYNTAHELAKANVPAALYACPRDFDDQAARAARFASASLAFHLERFDDDALRSALRWMTRAVHVRANSFGSGADRAADVLLDRMNVPARERRR